MRRFSIYVAIMLKITIITSLIAALLFLGLFLPSQTVLFEPEFHQQLHNLLPESVLSVVLFLAGCSFLMAIGMPRQIVAFSCGYSFGAINGVVSATLAASLGLAITYLFSHRFLSGFIAKRYASQSKKVVSFLIENLILKAFIIRILPLGSNFLTNIIAGACKLPLKPFWIGSTIGFVPQMIIFSLAGSGIRFGDTTQLIISLALFLVALLLSTLIYVKHKQKS